MRRAVALLALLAACGPPAHPHGDALQRVLALGGARWRTAGTAHIHLHARADTPAAAARAGELAARAEAARLDDLALLGAADPGGVIDVVVLPGREAMRPYTGGTPGGTAMTDQSAVLVIADGTTGVPLRHELMHVLSWRLWGTPAGNWVSEGLAMLPTPVCAGYTVDELVVGYRAEGRLPPLRELPKSFTARETGHYAAAGSLVRYVRGRWGMDGVRGLWVYGMQGTREALGVPLDVLERDWLDSLRATPERRIDWNRIRRYGCEAP